MSPFGTSTGPGVMCHTIAFDCGALDGSWAATMRPLAELSAVFAGTGVKASVPSAFFSRWFASAKCVADTVPLHVDWLADGFGMAQTSAVTKGSDDLEPSYTLSPTIT